MTTVFEGRVNGKIFNNVADYNKALTEALNNGEMVDASSNTYTVSGCACQGHENKQTSEERTQAPNLFYGMEEGTEYYLDTLKGDDSDEQYLKNWKDGLNSNKKEVLEYIKKFRSEYSEDYRDDLEDYRDDLEDVMSQIVDDANNIKMLINKFVESIKSNQAKEQQLVEELAHIRSSMVKDAENLKLMKSCSELNDMMTNHYSVILGEVENILNTPEEKNESVENAQNRTQFAEFLKKIFPSVE